MFLGSLGGGQMMEMFPAAVPNMAAALGDASAKDARPLPPWEDPDAATSAWRYLDLSGTVKSLVYGEQKKEAAPDLAAKLDADRDRTITLAEVQAAEATLQFGEHQYQREELVKAFKKIASLTPGGAVQDDQVRLTRKQWLAAQSPDWQPIWLWPGIGVLVMLLVFLIAFRPPPKQNEAPAGEMQGTVNE